MRVNIVHSGANELTYEIREIVAIAEKLEKTGVKIFWENIGDPVAKGEKVPLWIKEIVKEAIDNNKNFAYSPTRGLYETRGFLAEKASKKNGVKISPEDIIFFNGLGDAISKVYTYLNREARVIGPSPAYSTHSSAEAAHAGSPHITYNLLPEKNWLPDIDDLAEKIKKNKNISGILIINPDNPTGMVYPKKTLKKIVGLAKKYDLFLICDEIYANIFFGKEKMTPLASLVGKVPTIIMRGISKELPWPGARCGWIEVYNREKDAGFARYIKSIVDAKMLEVCSTTLPQTVIPKIMSDARYVIHLREKNQQYRQRAGLAYEIFKKVGGAIAPKPSGAFYMSVVFKDGLLNDGQKLKIENNTARQFVEELTDGGSGQKPLSPDKRFVYYLLASTGICVVPLSGFNSSLKGFRVTLLESDEKKFRFIYETIAEKITEYLGS